MPAKAAMLGHVVEHNSAAREIGFAIGSDKRAGRVPNGVGELKPPGLVLALGGLGDVGVHGPAEGHGRASLGLPAGHSAASENEHPSKN
jgi:hypothetical protein